MASRLSKRANSDLEKELEAKEIEEDTTSDEAFPSMEDVFNACLLDPNCTMFNPQLAKRADSDLEKELEAKEVEEDTTSDEAFPSMEDVFNACMNDPDCNMFNEHQTDYIPNTGGD